MRLFLLVSKFERFVRSGPRKLIKHITKESINGFHDHSTLKKLYGLVRGM